MYDLDYNELPEEIIDRGIKNGVQNGVQVLNKGGNS